MLPLIRCALTLALSWTACAVGAQPAPAMAPLAPAAAWGAALPAAGSSLLEPGMARLAAASATDPVTAGRDPPAGRAAECAASLYLPIGPLETCRSVILTTAIVTTSVMGFVAWWHRGLDTRFDVAHEGWFGPDTYSGGIDKLGHAFSFYTGTRLANRAFGWAGVQADESLALSMRLGLGLGLGIELLDGFARGGKYGFSWEDLAMDAAGVGLAYLAETYPAFDRWFAFRWLHTSSGDPARRYDHHQYYAVLRLSGWSALSPANPLRYVELLAGYGAQGFQGESTLGSSDQRSRSIYLGVGLNLTELLDRTAFAGAYGGGRSQWFATELLRYVQVPGTVATNAVQTWRP
jgi:hypothetical protein